MSPMSPNLPRTRFKIGPLIVEIFGRRYPDVDCPYDGNWLISDASLSEGSWTCPDADINAAELVEFHDHLDAYARGVSDEVSYFPSE